MKYTRHHVAIFLLTFFSYSLFHATRKTFSNIKDDLSKEWSPVSCNRTWPCPLPNETWESHDMFSDYKLAEPFLGILDTVFMFAYALGLYISGIIGDRIELRKVLSFGMCTSACMVFIFGTLTEWTHFYSKPFYIVIWGLGGLLQSTGWPSTVAIMGNWFGKSGRGLIFGFWSACASVGNIFGALMATALDKYGYEEVMLCSSFALFCGGIVVFFGLVNSPAELGLESPDMEASINSQTEYDPVATVENESTTSDDKELISNEQNQPIGFFRAFLLPGVIPYAFAYACVKLVNYAFFFWLPYYLTNQYHWADSKADEISIWYDVGGIIGGILFGILTDYFGQRSPTLIFMLLVAPFSIWGYQKSPNNVLINSVLMALVGLFIGGASNIISAAVTADLGKQPAIGKSTEALATVTGIIDGTGSVGAGIGQYLVAVIQTNLGWQSVFYSFIIMIFLSVFCLLPILIKDVKVSWYKFLEKRRIRNENVFANETEDNGSTPE